MTWPSLAAAAAPSTLSRAERRHPTRTPGPAAPRAGRPAGWLPRVLVALSLLVVALSVVGMHQLSIGHTLATTQTVADHQPVADHQTAADHHGPAGQDPVLPDASQSVDPAVGGGQPVGEGGCSSGCDGHSMAFSSCLLALTLLVLAWLLTPPPSRALPLFLAATRFLPVVRAALRRLVPALSLAELSLLRT